uniref:Integrase, catalytic region, zinc finger, CCHC-type, peptidase aspartic, catalytic n=1 Tax=Tanacetum cinerariifolium TaxID=118510 RepID=A0A6L2KD98_TANCI|nr:integrase, catalytic region, zinc finger, CCHC-type, peptidase aspartic, catalytic [Tanacetum cinerariifolium]
MSNTNNTMQTQTSNTLHNAIMESGGKDRPPMLAPGNYVQWRSRIKRYIDTKPNHELIHYCLKNPSYKYTWADKVVPVSKGSPETTTESYMENYKNVSQDIRDQLNVEAEAVQIILTWINNNIYSTVDACPNACEIWKAIERLKQGESINHQNEVNELRAERITRTANPLALVAQQQPVYHPQNHPTHYTHNSSTKSQQAATRNRGKAIVNFPPPIYDQEPSMVAEDDKISKDKEINKLMALISLSFKKIYKPTNNNLRTLSNTSRANQDNSPRINRGTGECQKPKQAKDAAYHKEKMLLCKQEKAGVQLNAEQADWRDDTDDESEDQELEAHYMYMAQNQEDTPDAADDSGPIFDSEPLQKNDDDADLANERELLASLIEKLKYEIDDSKNRNKFLKTSNKVLVDKLKGEIKDFKTKNKSLKSSNNRFKKANNKLSETNELMYNDLKKFQGELDRRNGVEYASKVEIDCAKAKRDLISYKMESQKSFNKYTQQINDLNQMISEIKKKLSTHQETISILSQAKEAQIKLYKNREDKELDKVITLENKVKRYFSERSKTSHTPVNNGNSKDSFNKQTTLLEKWMDESIMYDQKCKSSKELFKIKRSVRMIFDGVERCKETIAKRTYFGHIDPFIQNTIEANFCPEIRRINADLEKFHVCLKEEMVADLRYFNYLELEVDSLKSQLETQKTQFLNEIDRLLREYYYADHMNAILGVYTELDEVSNLQCDYLEMLKKCECLEKELSKSKMILNAKTSNVNFVCATCGKCVLNEKHDMCVLKSRNGVNSRTKMPIAVPVSTREHKRTIKQSVAKPLRRTVASESTNQKPRNTNKKLYEHVSKECSWWYPKFTPPRYKWKPKSQIRNVNPNLVEIILFIVDSGCSKHMTGNLKLLINFVEKFLGTVKFGNDQIAPILGYGDLVQGAVTIKKVYYVEGLNHNLFSVGQFCNADLGVAFRKSTCYIRDLKGNNLLTGSRGTNLYSITLQDTTSPNLIFLMAKATSSQAWLWHHRLSHLNFDTINLLSKNDIVIGLPKLKFFKDHLCSSCTKFLNKTLHTYYASEGILHQTSVARTPEQNSVVERRNRTLVEAARTMLSAAKGILLSQELTGAGHGALIYRKLSSLTNGFSLTMTAVQTFGSGNTFLLAVAFFFRQWEVPSGSGNFLTSSGNALCILFPTILP